MLPQAAGNIFKPEVIVFRFSDRPEAVQFLSYLLIFFVKNTSQPARRVCYGRVKG